MSYNNHHDGRSSFTEEFWIAGQDLVGRIKELVAEGNVRRIILRNEEGRALLDIPLNSGLALGGVALIIAPFLSAIIAIAAMTRKIKLEVVRDGTRGKDDQNHKDDDISGGGI